ncbi:MAG: hypothetical protein ABJA66_15085 [Actinomycetota bacterium]
MKKLIIVFGLLILFGLSAQIGFGQTAPQTDQERLIKASGFLEAKPFDKDAKETRAWAIKWASETTAVTVIVCGGTGGVLLDKKIKFGGELLGQYLISMTAFKLQNPDKANDENAAQLAGMESVVRTYEAMLKENPKAKAARMDDLLGKRNDGTLAKYVADADCGKK